MKLHKIIVLVSIIAMVFNSCTSTTKVDPALEKAIAEGKIYWMDIETVEKKMQENPKKVLVDVYTSWCGWCKRMDKDTFGNPEVVKLVNENFYAVKFNAESKKPVKYKGKTYDFDPRSGRKGSNSLAKVLLKGRLSYPTISFLDEEMNMINAYPGYKKADQFIALSNDVLGPVN